MDYAELYHWLSSASNVGEGKDYRVRQNYCHNDTFSIGIVRDRDKREIRILNSIEATFESMYHLTGLEPNKYSVNRPNFIENTDAETYIKKLFDATN